MKFQIHRVRSFFALGFGVEILNSYWHAKIYLGPWVVMINNKKESEE